MPDFDLSGFLDDDTWRVAGIVAADGIARAYAIPSPNGRDGLILQRIWNNVLEAGPEMTGAQIANLSVEQRAAIARLRGQITEDTARYCATTDGGPVSFDEKILGPTYQQMLDDGVSMVRVERVAQAAFMRFGSSEEAVRLVVAAEGKALAQANRAQRRAAAKTTPKPAKRTSSSPKGGSSSNQASTAANTPSGSASTRGRGTSAPRKPPPAKAKAS